MKLLQRIIDWVFDKFYDFQARRDIRKGQRGQVSFLGLIVGIIALVIVLAILRSFGLI